MGLESYEFRELKMKINKFEDLTIWKLSLKITKRIYTLTSKHPFSKDFGLRDQIQRAVVSISSNIVEGFEKNNNNEFIRYLKIAKGSVGEVRNQLYIATELNYISKEEFTSTDTLLIELSKQIGSLIVYLMRLRKLSQLSKLSKPS